jgi:ribonuclease J
MTVFEHEGRLLVVDCGVLFPSEDSPGVDLILPDFRAIEERLGDIDALVLTHGHEDHIGAVPFLLRQRPDLTVVGSRFTLALVAESARNAPAHPHLLEVAEGSGARSTGRGTASTSR